MDFFTIMLFFPIIYMIVFFLIIMLFLKSIMKLSEYRKKRQVRNIDKEMNYREIPCYNEIKVAYWLLYNYSNMNKSELYNGMFSAYLLSWYKKGYIDINITKRFGIFKNDYSIDLKNGTFPKDNSEIKLYSFFKATAKSNNILEKNEIKEYCSLDENRNKLRDLLEFILDDAEEALVKNNLLKVIPEKNYILFKIPKKFELSEELLNEYQNLIGLQNFLKDYSNMEEKQHIEVHLWEDYLVFANILGIADKVKEQFNKIAPDKVSTNQIFEPSLDSSLIGRIGIFYKLTKIQLVSYLFIFFIIAVIWFGKDGISDLIIMLLITGALVSLIYYPLKKYLTNKKVKEMHCMTEAKITDFMAHEHEEYDSETGKTIRTTTYTYSYEFYVNEYLYTGRGYSAGFFKPRKGKKVKIYFNKENPSENETKAEHNKYLRMTIFFMALIVFIFAMVKSGTT